MHNFFLLRIIAGIPGHDSTVLRRGRRYVFIQMLLLLSRFVRELIGPCNRSLLPLRCGQLAFDIQKFSIEKERLLSAVPDALTPTDLADVIGSKLIMRSYTNVKIWMKVLCALTSESRGTAIIGESQLLLVGMMNRDKNLIQVGLPTSWGQLLLSLHIL